jgi:hypothetical protein
MPWPHDLRTPTDINAPEPVGWCDRCYRKWPLAMLVWQYDYRGLAMQNLAIRVCPNDLDEPQPQLRPVIITGPEGVVKDPRPPYYAQNYEGGRDGVVGRPLPPSPSPSPPLVSDHDILG